MEHGTGGFKLIFTEEELKSKIWKVVAGYIEERKMELLTQLLIGDELQTATTRGAYFELDRILREAELKTNEAEDDEQNSYE
jgi:hypothetical protein